MHNFDLVENPSIGNDELNDLFHACWPDHVDEDYSHILERSLAYIC